MLEREAYYLSPKEMFAWFVVSSKCPVVTYLTYVITVSRLLLSMISPGFGTAQLKLYHDVTVFSRDFS